MRTTRLLNVCCSARWRKGSGSAQPPWMQTRPVNRMTHRCKNIIVLQTPFEGGKYNIPKRSVFPRRMCETQFVEESLKRKQYFRLTFKDSTYLLYVTDQNSV